MKWVKVFIGILAGIMACLIILAGAWMYWFVYRDLPSIHDLKNMEPTKVSTVVSAEGKTIGYFPPDGMIVLNGKNVPLKLKLAFIAAEDSGFYKHAGLDPKRIIVALIADIRATSYVQGASTITQQVVRSYLLSREKTITRKLKEIVLALRIERALSKDEILDLYLDRIYLGSGAYGIGAASLRYFGKECKDLSLAEMAMIAGVAPAPTRYSPLNDFLAAKRRQNYVLTRMIEEGYITEAEAAAAFKEPLKIKGEAVAQFTDYPYVTDYVRSLITERYGEEILAKGITIQTTISSRLQDAAMLAVRRGVIDLEMKMGKYQGPHEGMSEDQKESVLAFQHNQLLWQGPKLYQLYWAEVQSLSPLTVNIGRRNIELGPESYSWINPRGKWRPADVLKPGNMVRLCSTPDGFILFQDPKIQAALVAFDLETSGVTAIVGGVDYSQSQFNRAMYARRQSGSAIKPFIYAAAIDKGFTPSTIIFDAPIAFQSEDGEDVWKPKNYENEFYGATTLRTGLVLSRNVVTVKILKDIGIDYALTYLRSFDMGTSFPRNLSLALGTGVIIPYNLFKGYATFATYGLKFDPVLIKRIDQIGVGTIFTAEANPTPAVPEALPVLSEDDSVSIEGAPAESSLAENATTSGIPAENAPVEGIPIENRVLSEQTAYIITNILCDAVQNGTGWRAKELGRPVAGKTGTSDEDRDAWFVGYTPDALCGVWVGYDDNMISLGKSATGGTAACPIFTDFMQTALSGRPIKGFRVPNGIVFTRIDSKTGKLATNDSANVRFECYKADTMPQQQEQPTNDELLLKEIY
ncbi:MAG TPA: PBP1A family penicillin-binding protein [Deltaproteobacteria bacterium]|jgi:penicillin-binding protein 1A|nr:PBP1A family penicillin-binding protein [Deltaproteobacteria bacterium]HQI02095.1 PBP1A family penicillin-binding protein [Deltaproteobacteria bacterium]